MPEDSHEQPEKTTQYVPFQTYAAPKSHDPCGIYFKQICDYPRLTQEEEIYYAKQYYDANADIIQLLRSLPNVILTAAEKIFNQRKELHFASYMVLAEDAPETVSDHPEKIQEILDALSAVVTKKLRLEDYPYDQSLLTECEDILSPLTLKDPLYEQCIALLQDESIRVQLISPQSWPSISIRLGDAMQQRQAAKDILVLRNLRLVVSIAGNYFRYGIPLPDLIQEGNIGLMRAVSRYDYRLGHRFSTYATSWIRRAITAYLTNHSRTIRIASNTLKQINCIRRAEQKLILLNGIQPTPEAIADAAGLPVPKVRALMKMAQQPVSLQAPVSDDSIVAESIMDDTTPSPDETIARQTLKDSIFKAMNNLNDRERITLIKRFGLDDKPPMTMQQIAMELNISSERVRQIEAAAIKKLRQPNNAEYFEGYF